MGLLSMETEKGLFLGIDFGTTNSIISIYHYDSQEVITIPIDGSAIFPSVISFEEDQDTGGLSQVFGISARESAVLFPESTVMSVKRLLGEGNVIEIKTSDSLCHFTPEQIAGKLIQHLKACADEYVREELNITAQFSGCVITVPANSTDKQKKKTLEAAVLAGFDEDKIFLRLEPAAAALSYGFSQTEEKKVLVYDFGGGTFDACVLYVKQSHQSEPEISILSTYGDNYLGGDDIDKIMADMIYEHFMKVTDYQIDLFDFNRDDGVSKKVKKIALIRLFAIANQAKERLSAANATKVVLAPFIQEPAIVNINMDITREDFLNHKRKYKLDSSETLYEKMKDKSVKDLIEETIVCAIKCLDMSELDPEDLDDIFLVGGSSAIPEVKEQIKLKLKKEPYLGKISPALSISQGAALYCNMIMLPSISGPKVHEKTIHPLGIELSGRRFYEIVPKGVIIPEEGLIIEAQEPLMTNYDDMTTMSIVVYEDLTGSSGLRFVYEKGMKRLGAAMLRNIPPGRKGDERVSVIFKINRDYILTVLAKSMSDDGVETELNVDALY